MNASPTRHFARPTWRRPTGLPETGGPTTGSPGPMAAPAGQADEAMTRSEERMRVGTATEPAGRVRLRK